MKLRKLQDNEFITEDGLFVLWMDHRNKWHLQDAKNDVPAHDKNQTDFEHVPNYNPAPSPIMQRLHAVDFDSVEEAEKELQFAYDEAKSKTVSEVQSELHDTLNEVRDMPSGGDQRTP